MLAYADTQRRTAARGGSPTSLVLILVGHAVVIGAVLSAKMELVPGGDPFVPTEIVNVPLPAPPIPPEPPAQPPRSTDSRIDTPSVEVPIPKLPPALPLDLGPPADSSSTIVGNANDGPTIPLDVPRGDPVRIAARFATPADSVRPPYPAAKLRAEEEAVLRLRLVIDPRGRVISVDPVGRADPAFLESARRHIIRHWRYKPATEGGASVASSVTITLSFRLDDA
ncbi:energy transducer TonB [Sphingomonas xanthus]|uniref:Energy transducer TonB n=1 Tax=Sphingomonas xanthus TaxID=2594473 RepID=A0A516IRQ4_9SPHN|nr:energy transducer TonB [Sphingomonas xanthus]QDP19583.1 energy transducer TonB [Sphingomonas xanthus]